MFKFIARNYVLLLAVFAVAMLGSLEVLAQTIPYAPGGAVSAHGAGVDAATGPFAAFLRRGADLFYYTRNALFVLAAFMFVRYAWEAITKGKVENLENILWVIVALVLLGVSGFVVDWFAGTKVSDELSKPSSDVNMQRTSGFKSSGWGN